MRRTVAPPAAPDGRSALDLLIDESPLEGRAFLARYRTLRAHEYRAGEPHHPRAIAIAAAILGEEPRVIAAEIHSLLGGTQAATRAAQAAICTALGRPIPLQTWTSLTVGKSQRLFLEWAEAELGALPLTCLDRDVGSRMPAPDPRYCARVLALSHTVVRVNAAFALIVSAARKELSKRATDYLKAWESFDAWAMRSGADLGRQRHVPSAMLDWLGEDPSQRRQWRWTLLAKCAERIRAYREDHPFARDGLGDRFLAIPYASRYQEAREVAKASQARTKQRRAATADPIADRFSVVVRLLDRRFSEIATVREAFDQVCLELEAAGPKAERIDFAVTLPAATLLGDPVEGSTTLDFSVVRGSTLHARFNPVGGESEMPERFFLLYTGTREAREATRIPYFEACRHGAFVPTACRKDGAAGAYRDFAKSVGEIPALVYLTVFRYPGRRDRDLAERAFAAGLVLVPIAPSRRASCSCRSRRRTTASRSDARSDDPG